MHARQDPTSESHSQHRRTYPLTTRLLSSPSLSASPYFPDLVNVINRAFSHSHVHGAGYEIFPSALKRLWKPEQLGAELGSEGFCIIAFSSEGDGGHGRLVGTASAKPYHAQKAREGAGGELNLMFKRSVANKVVDSSETRDEEALPTWELLAMAVEPDLQGQGISTQLLGLALEEIKRRVAAETRIAKNGVRIFISTMKELNEEYYLKKGWMTTDERRFPRGIAGSTNAFTIVDMVRTI
ncbi:MAG: hypothetical protein Q9179_002150 [Wetmoreana sp. 5 TL-2023]